MICPDNETLHVLADVYSYGSFIFVEDFLVREKGSHYLDKYRNGSDFLDNETPFMPDKICPVNKTPYFGSRYPEFRITRPHCTV